MRFYCQNADRSDKGRRSIWKRGRYWLPKSMIVFTDVKCGHAATVDVVLKDFLECALVGVISRMHGGPL